MSNNKANFGETVIDFGRALGATVQTKKGFTRKYLVEDINSGDANVVKVFAHDLDKLPDDPAGMIVRFKDTDFVFSV